ncbi:pentapeptide repeat-containing protein [Roseofilum sp. BLCC_M154]|uniref:Pentapeptide repeat-containing protein n=1 Tax=Roseofilum acuticapitatum BLCC-M154 TaxID=3022444 RepID=A0ABT7AMS8_9CYAN|nr:pentapeptide repeat-containing protein [Roseofilum acuticapitatum]MDJ1168197.1 pentapeptide repeat-containing protein [Roseofilum acuticapitatum BLCC-M154]
MSQDTKPNQPPRQQSVGNTTASGAENRAAVANAGRDVRIDQHQIIYNYYYQSQIQSGSTESSQEPDNLPCPYRGLFHFGPEDAEFFFGREDFVKQLYKATQTRSFIPILGASGSGKSSVVFAGLVPKLQQEGNWQFSYFRPGAIRKKDKQESPDPLFALAQALVPLYAPNKNETERIQQSNQLANWLRSGEILLSDVIEQITHNYPQSRLLLIADQFEELYTVCEDETTRRQFLDILIDNIYSRGSDSPLVLVLTMRADFLGNALSYPSFAEVLHSDMKLGAMSEMQLRQVIEKPAQQLGVEFEPGLVASILDDIEEPGNLPLLEFALTQLWKQREGKQISHVAYQEIGGVKGALTRHADGVLQKWTVEERKQAQSILIRLVNLGEGTGDTRRQVTQGELSACDWRFVTTLATERLVVTGENGKGEETVEVVHEALIRYWGQLRTWVNENREAIREGRQLEAEAKEWDNRERNQGYLLQGRRLRDSREFQQEHGEDYPLSELAKAWIKASVRQTGRNRLKFGGLLVIPLAIVLGIVFAIVEPRIREARIEHAYNILKSGSVAEKPKAVLYLTSRCWRHSKLFDSFHPSLALNSALKSMPFIFGNCEPLFEANLSGANLSGADLSGADLSGANLWRANLSGAGLSGANLRGADLRGAYLSGTDLRGAYLSGADLSGQLLSGANLSGANLSGADLRGADLSGANLWRANLSGANLRGANLRGADLRGTDLSGTYLRGAYLSGADLRGAYLSGADLSRAGLSRADLSRADLSRADLSGTDLSGADLRGADLSGTDLRGADLSRANFRADEVREKVKDLTPEQVKSACGWQEAKFDPEFLQQLSASPDPQEPPDCSRWE